MTSEVTYKYNFAIFSECLCSGLSNAVFGSMIGPVVLKIEGEGDLVTRQIPSGRGITDLDCHANATLGLYSLHRSKRRFFSNP